MSESPTKWVRCQITPRAHNYIWEVSRLTLLPVGSCQTAVIEFITRLLTPREFAERLLAALDEPESEREEVVE